ncbi:hypothetical protein SAMN05421504_105695 [Amycolatopsis xylanica]|uniref:Uncharacterized protein n=1 Tax=Amycolatopsis xylanica TaxID=589385 RepID=A0A1H3K8J9_9PSEU|nr:hypothetical protein [Amycolatopsis xylanica]SDY48510.1 hypothetical protein SAMN05421504_105695 [Amycolatopsis xylanica]
MTITRKLAATAAATAIAGLAFFSAFAPSASADTHWNTAGDPVCAADTHWNGTECVADTHWGSDDTHW